MPSPLVVFSMVGSDPPSGAVSNSTVKLFNQWALMLGTVGLEACVATVSGRFQPWLANHANYRTWDQLVGEAGEGRDLTIVTAGWEAHGVWDFAETTGQRLHVYMPQPLREGDRSFLNTMMGSIAQLAVPNRYLQAWIMATYHFQPTLLTIPTDCSVFYPDPSKRDMNKVGFFHSPEAPKQINYIGEVLKQYGQTVDFVLLRGTNHTVANSMRECGFFLGLNMGHDPMWGSGVSITHQEAMASGCMAVVFDLKGNQEYILHNENALVVPCGDMNALISAFVTVKSNPKAVAMMATNAVWSIRARRSISAGIPSLLEWLGLKESVGETYL